MNFREGSKEEERFEEEEKEPCWQGEEEEVDTDLIHRDILVVEEGS